MRWAPRKQIQENKAQRRKLPENKSRKPQKLKRGRGEHCARAACILRPDTKASLHPAPKVRWHQTTVVAKLTTGTTGAGGASASCTKAMCGVVSSSAHSRSATPDAPQHPLCSRETLLPLCAPRGHLPLAHKQSRARSAPYLHQHYSSSLVTRGGHLPLAH